MGFTVERLQMDDPLVFTEQVGDPVSDFGGTPAPAPRSALRHSVSLPTYTANAASDTVAQRLTLRRQLRSMLNNSPWKLAGLYVQWAADLEQDGWYVPDMGQLTDGAGDGTGLSSGYWQLANVVWRPAGKRRTHRRASQITMLSVISAVPQLTPRDYLQRIYSTDFSQLVPLAISYLPADVTDVVNSNSGAAINPFSLGAAFDGGSVQAAPGLANLSVASYEQVEASQNLAGCLIYDRRGITLPPEAAGQLNAIFNPSFEHDVLNSAPAGWTTGVTGGAAVTTFQAQNGFANQGVQSARFTASAMPNASTVFAATIATAAYVVGGLAYSFGTHVDVLSVTTATVKLNVNWRDAAGALISSVASGTKSTTGLSALTILNTTAPAAAAYAQVQVVITATALNGAMDMYFDACQAIQAAALPGTYFDGDTANYIWLGTPGNAASSQDPQLYGWQEVYGPDWPFYWPITSTTTPDTPVIANGYTRVRYDATNTPGWRIDVWTGATWLEQCKVLIYRNNLPSGLQNYDINLLSTNVEEYTPERVVIKAVMNIGLANDPSSRETIFITLQRGWLGPRFEVYTAPTNTATPLAAQAVILITPAATDADDSAFVIVGLPTGGGSNVSTALGTGHTGLFGVNFGAGSLSDNGTAMLRSLAAGAGGLALGYQINVGVAQAASSNVLTQAANAYGVLRNAMAIEGPPSGVDYLFADIGFSLARTHQIMEAENMTLGTNTSSTADATASAGTAASTTRTTDANPHCQQPSFPDGVAETATYRVFARVRTTAGTMNVYAKTDNAGGTTGATKTTVSTTYVWLDLGDLVNVAGTFEIHAWTSSGTCFVDRIECYLRKDQGPTGKYAGVQDNALAALYDSLCIGGIVARA